MVSSFHRSGNRSVPSGRTCHGLSSGGVLSDSLLMTTTIPPKATVVKSQLAPVVHASEEFIWGWLLCLRSRKSRPDREGFRFGPRPLVFPFVGIQDAPKFVTVRTSVTY